MEASSCNSGMAELTVHALGSVCLCAWGRGVALPPTLFLERCLLDNARETGTYLDFLSRLFSDMFMRIISTLYKNIVMYYFKNF